MSYRLVLVEVKFPHTLPDGAVGVVVNYRGEGFPTYSAFKDFNEVDPVSLFDSDLMAVRRLPEEKPIRAVPDEDIIAYWDAEEGEWEYHQ